MLDLASRYIKKTFFGHFGREKDKATFPGKIG